MAIPIRLDNAEGRLLVAGPGRHTLEVSGQPLRRDRGPGSKDPWSSLWRTVDLFALVPDDRLSGALDAAGFDLVRSGYARTPRSTDGVAYTLGAKGEGEPELPQAWFARAPLWPVRVRMPGSGDVVIGPSGAGGWPSWFELPDGRRLDLLGPPVPWAGPGLPDLPPELSPLPENWRRAF